MLRFFCNNSFKKKKYRNEIEANNNQWVNNGFIDFNKTESCPHMRERGVHFMDIKIKNMLNTDISIPLCDSLAHNRAIKLKL